MIVRLLGVAISLLAVAAAASQFHATQDDAFISYRYATHLVDTGSLTFNGPGYERVEGYSNFTWTLLLALAYAAGPGPYLASKLIGLACLVAAIHGAMRLADEVLGRESPWRLLAGLAVASSSCFTAWSVQGLETPLVAALVVWSAAAIVGLLRAAGDGAPGPAVRARALAAGCWLGLLGVSRPETALFGGIGLAALALAARWGGQVGAGTVLRVGIAFAIPVAAQLAFRLAYYGRITANTVYAKVHGEGRLWRGRTYLEHYAQAKGIEFVACGLALFLFAVVLVARRKPRSLVGPAVVAAFAGAYAAFIVAAGGDWMRGFRFCMHALPLAAVLGCWSLARVAEALRVFPVLRAPLLIAALAGLLYSNLHLERQYRFGTQGSVAEASAGASVFHAQPVGVHWRVGRWLRDNLPAGSLVALSEAGIIPFTSDLPVLDYLGLNERRIADLLQAGRDDAAIAAYVFDRDPAALVMTGRARPGVDCAGRLDIDRALQADARFAQYRLARLDPLTPPRASGFTVFATYVRRGIVPGPLLTPDRTVVTEKGDDTQALVLDCGAEHAGRTYVALGSAGDGSGFVAGGRRIPLDPDAYCVATLLAPDAAFRAGRGVLDVQGKAHVVVQLPAAARARLAGRTLWHACVLVDPGRSAIVAVSNAVPLLVAP